MEPDFSRGYIPGIDGLRAIAVLAVIMFHMELSSVLPGGFTGVDVFFVISGYVISKSLAEKFSLGLGGYITRFYKRRLTRIMPALLVMLVVTILLSTLFIPSSWLSSSLDTTGLSAFFGYSNFSLAWNNDTYFSPRVDFNPFLHTWSLAVEEQFYLIFPLIFYFLLKSNNARNTPNRQSGKRLIPLTILMILAGASFIYAMYESSANSRNAFYLLPSRFWELAAGAILFQLHAAGRWIPNTRGQSAVLTGAGLVLTVAGFLLANQRAFPFPWALLPVLGTVLLICGVLEQTDTRSPLQTILASDVLTYIGSISYSLYLWHWPVAVLFRWTYGFESLYIKMLYIPLVFVLAMISYHVIENPIRRSALVKTRRSGYVVAVSLLVIAAGFLAARTIVQAKPVLSLSVTRDTYTWQSRRYHADGPDEPVTDDPRILGRKLFAAGDSHTATYRTMLAIVSKELGIEVIEYEAGGCAVAGLLKPMDEEGRTHYEEVLHDIRDMARPGDVVFLASLRMPEFAGQFEPVDIDAVTAAFFSDQASTDRKLALEEAHAIIEELTGTGAYVVLEAPLPVLFAPPYRCSDWFNLMNPIGANGLTVPRDFLVTVRQPVMESIAELVAHHDNLYVWDPFPVLCTDEIFSAYDLTGKPIFRDGDHLSGHGNRILEPSFRAFLIDLWSM